MVISTHFAVLGYIFCPRPIKLVNTYSQYFRVQGELLESYFACLSMSSSDAKSKCEDEYAAAAAGSRGTSYRE
jgi:hypothetical protein